MNRPKLEEKAVYLMEIIELINRVPVWICSGATPIPIGKTRETLKYRKEQRREKGSWVSSLMARFPEGLKEIIFLFIKAPRRVLQLFFTKDIFHM